MDNSKLKIVVIGSLNYDITSYMDAFPKPNETVFANSYKTAIGGKGLNQAVAAARQGAQVTMIGCVGQDGFGDEAIGHLDGNNVNTDYIARADTPTGFAAINVDGDGNNMISVASGANMALTAAHVQAASAVIETADMIITQSEVSIKAMGAALKIAKAANVPSILNPAPADKSVLPLLADCTYVTPNESETETLTGTAPEGAAIIRAIDSLRGHGAQVCVITRGSQGSVYADGEDILKIKADTVEAVDTTGAGDVYNGVLAVGLAAGLPPAEAVGRAGAAAAISVTRPTADSAPSLDELNAFLAAK